jgi:hypothetical protein
MLRRMAKDGLLKIQKYDLLVPDFFMLPGTPQLKGYDKSKHERGGGDLFVSFYPHIDAWSFEPPIGSQRADRGLKFGEITYYFEVDRCTEGIKKIREKLESYINYQSQSKERFRVIFTLLSDDDRKIANRGESLTRLFEEYSRGNMFVAGNHNTLVADPLGEVLWSYKHGAVSIKNL